MLFFAASMVVGLSLLNYRVARSTCYPPFLFCALWGFLLFAVALCASRFGELSPGSIIVYVLGTVAFTCGGFLAPQSRPGRLLAEPGLSLRHLHYIRYLIVIGSLALLATWPLYWQYLTGIAATVENQDFWFALRAGTIAQAQLPGVKSLRSMLFDNLAVSAILLALTAAAHYGQAGIGKLHLVGAGVIALVYNLGTASRSGAALVIISMVGIRALKLRAFRRLHVAIALVGMILVYVSMAVLLKKGGSIDDSVSANMQSLGDSMLLYGVAPLVAFDHYMLDPAGVQATWGIFRPYQQLGDRLGLDVGPVPSTHTGYVMVGSERMINVYTMYFSYYPQFGYLGVLVLTCFVGFVCTAVYRLAREDRPLFVLLYGLVFFEISMSGFHEGFWLGVTIYAKAVLYGAFVYGLLSVVANSNDRRASRRLPECVDPGRDGATPAGFPGRG